MCDCLVKCKKWYSFGLLIMSLILNTLSKHAKSNSATLKSDLPNVVEEVNGGMGVGCSFYYATEKK